MAADPYFLIQYFGINGDTHPFYRLFCCEQEGMICHDLFWSIFKMNVFKIIQTVCLNISWFWMIWKCREAEVEIDDAEAERHKRRYDIILKLYRSLRYVKFDTSGILNTSQRNCVSSPIFQSTQNMFKEYCSRFGAQVDLRVSSCTVPQRKCRRCSDCFCGAWQAIPWDPMTLRSLLYHFGSEMDENRCWQRQDNHTHDNHEATYHHVVSSSIRLFWYIVSSSLLLVTCSQHNMDKIASQFQNFKVPVCLQCWLGNQI